MSIEQWEIDLNGYIEVIHSANGEYEEYVPFMAAKAMIAQRESMLAEAFEIIELRRIVSDKWQAIAWSAIGTAFALLIGLGVLLWR